MQQRNDTSRQTQLVVGRTAEVAYLEQCLEAALGGERQVVFVSGEPGIGKTTIVNAFLQQIIGAGNWELGSGPHPSQSLDTCFRLPTPQVRVGWGQCIERYGAGEAYLPLLEIGTRMCQGPDGEQAIAMLRQYAPTWLVQLPGVIPEAEWEQLQRRVQGATRERMLREAAEVTVRFTQEQGYVLVLEDLHWSDVSTLEWLSYIAQRQEAAKLLIIGTYRPQEVLVSGHPLRGVVQNLSSRNRCEELHVVPLSEPSVSDYLSSRFGSSVAASALPGLIHRRTGGNPLFMVNVADYLTAQQVLQQSNAEWHVRGDVYVVADSVPQSLQHLIERQLERLPEEAQHVLEVASVVGMEFSAAEVATGLQGEVEAIETQCEDLVRKGQFLRGLGAEEWPDGTLAERYSFLHALYRDVLYKRLAETRRVRLHRRIGERKEAAYGERAGEIAAELAAHFEQGREAWKAVSYHARAGENAIRRHADHEAVDHFTQGLELLHTLPESPERVQRELQLQIALATPLKSLKGYASPEVEQVYVCAQALCRQEEHAPQLILILGGLITLHHTRAEFRKAQELGDRLLALSRRVSDPLLEVQAHFKQGSTLYDLADFPSAQRHLERALTCYDPRTHPDHIALYGGRDPGVGSLQWLALTLWRLGYPDQAQQYTQQALTLARELAHPFSLAWAHYIAVVVHYYRGEGTTSYEHVRAAVTLAREHGFTLISAMGAISEGWAQVEQGGSASGIAQIRQGLRMYQETGARHSLPGYLAVLAGACARNGQMGEARAAVDEALALVGTTGQQLYEPDLYLLKGVLMLQQFSPEEEQKSKGEGQKAKRETNPRLLTPAPQAEAEACFRKALEVARHQQAKSLELRAAMTLAHLWQGQGKVDEARHLLEEIYNWFTEGFDTKDLQEAATLLTELGGSAASSKFQVPSSKSEQAESKKETSGRAGERESARREDDRFVAHSPLRPFTPSPHPFPSAQPLTPNTFRSEGDYWTVTFAGKTCRIRDTLGHALSRAVAHPSTRGDTRARLGDGRTSTGTTVFL